MLYNIVQYGVNRETEMIDYDEVERLAVEHKPKMILAGASAYPRVIDFARLRAIADLVGAPSSSSTWPTSPDWSPPENIRTRFPTATWSPPPPTRRCADRAAA